MNYQRFDEFYLTICKEVGGIEQFVNSFFDFLARKTDFYYESFPGDKMGFPPAWNKQLIFKIMEKYQKEHYKKIPQRSGEQFNRRVEEAKKAMAPKQAQQKTITQKEETSTVKQVEQVAKVEEKMQKPQTVEKKAQVEPVVNSYNGGKNDKYTWSQEIREVEVTIEVDPELTAKMLKVEFTSNSVDIRKKTGELVIGGELVERINASESYWKVEKTGSHVFINLNLEKAEEKIWSTVFKGDPEIDTSKVTNTKPLQEFDDQTQGAIRKIMHEQKRKQMGLPTTEEEQQHEALKMAWDVEGSPFKGQPFDPSLVNLAGSQFNPNA